MANTKLSSTGDGWAPAVPTMTPSSGTKAFGGLIRSAVRCVDPRDVVSRGKVNCAIALPSSASVNHG
jgi:hypothetical protein